VIDEREVANAAGLITGAREAVVLGHQHPDGDSIGSVLAMAMMLDARGIRVQASWPDPFAVPSKYSYLPGTDLLVRPSDVRPAELVVALDCANLERLEDFKRLVPGAGVVNVDHHPDNPGFGDANLVDQTAAATAEIIYICSRELGLVVELDPARCLYTGLVTDTGRFQFTNTSPETFRVASEMVALGVRPVEVYDNVYQGDSLAYMRLTGEVLSRAEFDEGLGLVYAGVTREELRARGIGMDETEDLIDSIRTLKGHRIAALFKEQEDGRIRVSLRSRPDVDIGKVARALGGGGHKVAAGYTSHERSVEGAVEELKGALGAI
jgi:phosphoesterase RecJ-like protein